jgi:AraC-like DNA-binding protein
MVFHFNLYSSLLLVFFVHILIYAGMLWRRGLVQERLPDQLLGSFLFLAALYVLPWMGGFAGWYNLDENPGYREMLFYTPFVHGLFFGPLLYLYVKSITNFNYRLSRRDWLHFVPGLLFIVWNIIMVVVDKLILKRYYIMNGENDPDFDSWYQVAQLISIIAYLAVSVRYYNQYRRFTFLELSFADIASMRWLRDFLIAFGLLTLLPFVQLVLEQFPFFRKLDYVGPWYQYIGFALVVYYIAINGYNVTMLPLHRVLFTPQAQLGAYRAPQQLPAPEIADAEFEVVATETIAVADSNLQPFKEKLLQYMEVEKPYLDAEITLSALAKKIGTNASILSRIVNTDTGSNFNDFINGYRVETVRQMLQKGEHKRQTLLGIAFDCGFNSKATFNRAFKKLTGLAPKEYIGQMKD